MRWILNVVLFSLIAAAVSHTNADQAVQIVVRVPPDTPQSASVYVAGSIPGLGNWRADGLKLIRQKDGTFTGDVDLPIATNIEFKVTRGSWSTVEKHADGTDRRNRRIIVDPATQRIDATVELWATGKPSSRPPSTVVGTLKLHTIESRILKQPRTIRVWLPPDYEANGSARYGVLYMHDGQNCFDRRTSAFGNEWEIDETLSKLITEKY